MALPEHTLQFLREKLLFTLSLQWSSVAAEDERFFIEYTQPKNHAKVRFNEEYGVQQDIEFVSTGSTQKRGFSRCPLPVDAFDLTRTVKAVQSLDNFARNLVLYGYAERPEYHHFEFLARALWVQFQKQNKQKLRKKKEEKLKAMATLAVTHFRSQLQNDKYDFSPAKLIKLLDVNEHHWRRDWLPFWRAFNTILNDRDAQALTHVYQRINTRAGKDTSQPDIAVS